IEVPLKAGRIDFGSLLLFGDGFTEDDRMTAASLASQAVVALDNARLHRIVEKQARIDGLTALANRRHFEDQLAAERARVERFGVGAYPGGAAPGQWVAAGGAALYEAKRSGKDRVATSPEAVIRP